MSNSRIIVSEIMKTTFLILVFFTFFDLLIQGYSNYHNWTFTFYIALFSLYYFLSKRYL